MFVWTSGKAAHVEAINAVDNQAFGRALGSALRKFPQRDERDLWQVVFRFV